MTASQTMVEMPMALALAPLPAQGDTAEKPRPTPSRISINDKAAAPMAPAKIAAQETPEPFCTVALSVSRVSAFVIIVVELPSWIVAVQASGCMRYANPSG
ncbi:hypothetical protein D3C81_1867090 [compost metagenome]